MKQPWFTIKKLTKHIWGIGEFRHFEEVISYVIVGQEKALLIDTGLGIENIRKCVKQITDKKTMIIHTHGHYDHIGGDTYFFKSECIKNKQSIKIYPFSFNIIHTPGHSADSICLYETKKHILFSGDSLYVGPIYLFMKDSNIKEYLKSLIVLSKLKIKKIYPSHNTFDFPVYMIKTVIQAIKNMKEQKDEIRVTKKIKLLLKDTR